MEALMQPTANLQHSSVANWSIPVQLIDQFAAAVVVINSLPFRGRIDRLPLSQSHLLQPLRRMSTSPLAAVFGYAVAEPLESINRAKRHELTTVKLRVSPAGGADVLHR